MSRTENVFTIFLASPQDVREERKTFNEVVDEWNRAWSRFLGLRIELLMWENDILPGIGDDPQDVINNQIDSKYDLFVGIMWGHFGTPTKRAESGTAEEFENALAKYRQDKKSVNIFFYFKDSPIPPSKISPEQIQKIHEFKRSIAKEGVLYSEFIDTNNFEKLAKLHIAKLVQNWKSSVNLETPRVSDKTSSEDSPYTEHGKQDYLHDSTEEGYLDYIEYFETKISEVSDITRRITEAQESLTDTNNSVTSRIEELLSTSNGVSREQARSLISTSAEEMSNFSSRIELEIPKLHSAMDEGIGALVKIATFSDNANIDEAKSTRDSVQEMLTAISGAKNSTASFRDATSKLPRLTKDLNLAKRKQLSAIDSLIAEFDNSERLVSGALTVLDGALARARGRAG